MAGAVGRVAGPRHRRLAVVAGVAAEAALVDLALGRAVERQAEVLELDDGVDGLAAHDLGRGLVDEVVAALHRVEGVPLPRVLFDVGQRRAHAALGRAGVGPGRVELGEDGGAALAGRLDGGPQAGAAGADDDGVVAVVVDLHGPESSIGSSAREIDRADVASWPPSTPSARQLEVEGQRPRRVGRPRPARCRPGRTRRPARRPPSATRCSPPGQRQAGGHGDAGRAAVRRSLTTWTSRASGVAGRVRRGRAGRPRRSPARQAAGQRVVARLGHALVVEHRPRDRRVAVGEAELAEAAGRPVLEPAQRLDVVRIDARPGSAGSRPATRRRSRSRPGGT